MRCVFWAYRGCTPRWSGWFALTDLGSDEDIKHRQVSWAGSRCHLPGNRFGRHAWSGHVRDGKDAMEPGFAASEIDTSRPHPARMYDAYLGGRDNYPVDREAVREILRLYPEVRPIALANRAFLQRVVRFLAAEAGVPPFLPIRTRSPPARDGPRGGGDGAPAAPGGCVGQR